MLTRRDAMVDEPVRQPVGAFLELGIGALRATTAQGDARGHLVGHRFPQVGQVERAGGRRRRHRSLMLCAERTGLFSPGPIRAFVTVRDRFRPQSGLFDRSSLAPRSRRPRRARRTQKRRERVDSEDFEGIRSVVRDFVRTTVVPVENDIEESDEVPDRNPPEAAKKMGLFGFAIPEAYGGLGLSMEEEGRLVIELGYTTPALRSMFGTNNGIAGHVLMEGGTPRPEGGVVAQNRLGRCRGLLRPDRGRGGIGPLGADHQRRSPTGTSGSSTAPSATSPTPPGRRLHGLRPHGSGRPGLPGASRPSSSRGEPPVSPSDPATTRWASSGPGRPRSIFDDVRVARRRPGRRECRASTPAGPPPCVVWPTGASTSPPCCVGMADRLVDESVEYARNRKPVRTAHRRLPAHSGPDRRLGDRVPGRAQPGPGSARAFDDGSDRKVGPSTAKYFCSEMVGRVADRAVQIHGGRRLHAGGRRRAVLP